MSTKLQQTQTASPASSRALRLVGRFYRWVAWTGVLATIFFSGMVFVEQWRWMTAYTGYGFSAWDILKNAGLASGFVFVAGLFMCGMAFLVSLLIEAGVRMLENSYEQTDLLRQMVLHQSDVTSSTRLSEKAAVKQADLSAYETVAQGQQSK